MLAAGGAVGLREAGIDPAAFDYLVPVLFPSGVFKE